MHVAAHAATLGIDKSEILSPEEAFCEVRTVSQMGWSGATNGRLLQLAYENEFVALITADKNIEHQQNLSNLPVMLIVLVAYGNRLQDLDPMVPGILDVLEQNSEPGIYRIDA